MLRRTKGKLQPASASPFIFFSLCSALPDFDKINFLNLMTVITDIITHIILFLCKYAGVHNVCRATWTPLQIELQALLLILTEFF